MGVKGLTRDTGGGIGVKEVRNGITKTKDV